AQEIDLRHKILFSFFSDILGINPDLADEDACKIEHVISQPTLERLVKFLDFIKTCYKEKDNLLDNFKKYLSRKKELSLKK
ncbi:metal-dependent transcriptional regulator, partial [Candidatus Aerophobetes bacterium]|nr:metal-dependent transcriptional regulator [Candidatus Aerophobetes bacterium]